MGNYLNQFNSLPSLLHDASWHDATLSLVRRIKGAFELMRDAKAPLFCHKLGKAIGYYTRHMLEGYTLIESGIFEADASKLHEAEELLGHYLADASRLKREIEAANQIYAGRTVEHQ